MFVPRKQQFFIDHYLGNNTKDVCLSRCSRAAVLIIRIYAGLTLAADERHKGLNDHRSKLRPGTDDSVEGDQDFSGAAAGEQGIQLEGVRWQVKLHMAAMKFCQPARDCERLASTLEELHLFACAMFLLCALTEDLRES